MTSKIEHIWGLECHSKLLKWKVIKKVLELDEPQDQQFSLFFPGLSGRKHPGDVGCRRITQEIDPQPQEHQLVQTALRLLGLVQVLLWQRQPGGSKFTLRKSLDSDNKMRKLLWSIFFFTLMGQINMRERLLIEVISIAQSNMWNTRQTMLATNLRARWSVEPLKSRMFPLRQGLIS